MINHHKGHEELLKELEDLKHENEFLKTRYEQDIPGHKLVEESLRENEERFRSLYENSTMGLYRTTPDGKIILANPTLVKMLGYSSFEELATRNLEKDGFEPTYERKLFFEQIEKDGEVIGLESGWTCKDGTFIYIIESAKAIRGSNGKTLYYDGTIENITKRKKAEETLKIRNRDLAILNNIAIGLTSIRKESDFYRFIVNQLKNLTGSSLATFGLYDFQTREIHVKHADYDKNLYEDLTKALGGAKLLENSFPVSDEIRRVLVQDPVKFQSTLTDVTFGVVPPTIGKLIQKIEGFDRFIGIAYIVDDELYGTSVLSFRTDKPNPSLEILNLFANMVAVSLKRKLAEEAKNESEEKYRSLINEVNDGYYIVNEQGVITFSNNAFAKMIGFSKSEEIISHNIIEFIKEDNIHFVSGLFSDALSNKVQSNAFELEAQKINGQTIYLSITFVPIQINNKVVGLRGTIRDVTEAKRVEEELHRVGTAIEQTADWVVITNKEGIIQYVNPAFTEISGFSKEEALGKTPRILKSGHHPPPPKLYEKLWETILRGEIFSTTFTNKRKDGKLIYEFETITPIKDKEGNITHFVATGKEITEQRRAEEEIIFQKNRFAQLFDNSPIAITLLDGHDKIILINESFSNLFGYFLEEIKGKSIDDFIVPPELKEEAKRYLEQTHEGNQINRESYRRRKDGTLVYVQLVGVPVIINEKIVGVYKMYVDLTQRKITEEELINAKEKAEEVSRLKSNFLTNMSHELRTPLNGIMGYADLLIPQLVDPEQIEMTQGIFDSGKRLSETLNFILDLSKAETDTIEVIAKDVAVVPLAIDSINLFSNGAAKRNLQLETIIKEENIFAHLDGHLFSRILYNLLDNAFKFTHKGKISVEIGKELIAKKDWLYIKIKDTGIGIAPNKIDLIWEDFRQVSEGLSRRYEGTGLGLTISKKAVELMQGVISVESELGVGSVFTVKFPTVNAVLQKEELMEEKQAAAIQAKIETAKTAALPLVLCVEDDFVNRDIVKIYLKNICILETAEDGETALQLATEKKYDLILMDINLGTGINGIEVVKELLKMPKYAGTPIIAVSAYVTGKDKAEFLKGGGTHYLTKPFQKREVLDLVKNVLKNN